MFVQRASLRFVLDAPTLHQLRTVLLFLRHKLLLGAVAPHRLRPCRATKQLAGHGQQLTSIFDQETKSPNGTNWRRRARRCTRKISFGTPSLWSYWTNTTTTSSWRQSQESTNRSEASCVCEERFTHGADVKRRASQAAGGFHRMKSLYHQWKTPPAGITAAALNTNHTDSKDRHDVESLQIPHRVSVDDPRRQLKPCLACE